MASPLGLYFSCVLHFHFYYYFICAAAGGLSWVCRPLGPLQDTVVCAQVRVASECWGSSLSLHRICMESTG